MRTDKLTNCFEISYDERNITVFSSRRPRHMHKDAWEHKFKQTLRKAIRQLHLLDDEGIIAEYGVDNIQGGNNKDVENTLFYDIGVSTFREATQHHVAFQTLLAEETKSRLSQTKERYHHYYSYRVTRFDQRTLKPSLEWHKLKIPFPLTGKRNPRDYWELLRKHIKAVVEHNANDITGHFGVELQFYEPEQKNINLAERMKVILDGVICAFQRMPDDVNRESLAEVSKRLGLPIEQFFYKEKAILANNKEYIRPYRENVFWSPQDDRCIAGKISIVYGASERSFSGWIYQIAD